MLKIIIGNLNNGVKLTSKEIEYLFNNIINNKINNIKLINILINIKFRKESYEELTGIVLSFLYKFGLKINLDNINLLSGDILGTGGGLKTFNISTIITFILGEFKCKIIKYGNKNITSKSGSFDLLNMLNINYDINIKKSIQLLKKINISFLFIDKYCNYYKEIYFLRKQLNVTTILNLIGPLINPIKQSLSLIGVYNKEKILYLSKTLLLLNKYFYSIIIYSGGLDEVNLNSIIYIAEVKNNYIKNYKIKPSMFGLSLQYIKPVCNNSIKENILISMQILRGKGKRIYEYIIAANVAIGLKIFGYKNIKKNIEQILDLFYNNILYNRLLSLSFI